MMMDVYGMLANNVSKPKSAMRWPQLPWRPIIIYFGQIATTTDHRRLTDKLDLLARSQPFPSELL